MKKVILFFLAFLILNNLKAQQDSISDFKYGIGIETQFQNDSELIYSPVTSAFSEHPKGLNQVGYLSEQLGESWGLWSSQYSSSYRTVVNIDTTVTVNSVTYNHCIKVNDYGSSHLMASTYYYSNYFAKNVGFIKRE
jgi:hypothetical protein